MKPYPAGVSAPSTLVRQSPLTVTVAGTAALAAAMGLGRFVYTPILPKMMAGLGMSAGTAGLLASANYAGYLFGAVLAGGAWAQGRERGVTLASVVVVAVTLFGMAGTDGVPAFFALRFVAGVASAFVLVIGSALVVGELTRLDRPELQSWHFGGIGLGIAVSAAVVGGALFLGGSWRMDWAVSGLAAAVGGGIAAWGLPPSSGRSEAVAEPSIRWNPSLVLLTLGYGVFGAGYIVTATFLLAIVRASGSELWMESGVWLVAGLAGTPSVYLWGRLLPRLGLPPTILLGCVAESAGVAASVLMPAPWGPLLGGLALGGTFIAVTALGLRAGRKVAGESPRRVLSLMTVAFSVGQIVGPIGAGWMADATGSFKAGSLVASGLLLLSGTLSWAAGRVSSREV